MVEIIPGPAYCIHTQRLVIRCWNPDDAPKLKSAIDQSLDHLLPWMPWAYNEPEDIQKKVDRLRNFRGRFDLGQDFVYGIFSKDESEVLGGTGLHTRLGIDAREIGYWIRKDSINQGLATEVSAALTKVAFEIDKMRRVEIHCDPDNVRSAAVPRKLGFNHEATLRKRVPKDKDEVNWGDSMIWTLFVEDYPSTPAASIKIEVYDAMERRIMSGLS